MSYLDQTDACNLRRRSDKVSRIFGNAPSAQVRSALQYASLTNQNQERPSFTRGQAEGCCGPSTSYYNVSDRDVRSGYRVRPTLEHTTLPSPYLSSDCETRRQSLVARIFGETPSAEVRTAMQYASMINQDQDQCQECQECQEYQEEEELQCCKKKPTFKFTCCKEKIDVSNLPFLSSDDQKELLNILSEVDEVNEMENKKLEKLLCQKKKKQKKISKKLTEYVKKLMARQCEEEEPEEEEGC